MKANELRIGNYVSYEGRPPVVIEDGHGINASDIFSPIPLTEEWLVKFGYQLDGSNVCWQGVFHTVHQFNETFVCGKNGVLLKYVHQLQNLYFALTGEDLTTV